MNEQIITGASEFGKYGSIGIVIASILAIVTIVLLMLRFFKQESELNRVSREKSEAANREVNKEIAIMLTKSIEGLTKAIKEMGDTNTKEHRAIHEDVKYIKYKIEK